MPLVKSPLSVLAAQTTSQTSSAVDVSDAYGSSLYVAIVQAGTPTASATWQPQYSPDGGTTWYNGPVYTHALAATTYYWGPVSIPPDTTHVRVAFAAQSGGTSSTITAQVSKITGL